jgi:hypothetical protein
MTLGVLNGCNGLPAASPTTSNGTEQVQGASTGSTPADKEANNGFAQASPVDMPAGGTVDFSGALQTTIDVDVFDLGPAVAGDRIIVDVAGDPFADLAVALFDQDRQLIIINDDRNFFGGQVDPLVDVVLRHDSTNCYAVIASSPLASGSGTYTVEATKLPGQTIPPPFAQTVVLDFNGGSNVQISNMTPVSIPPFDAADISAVYTGQTNAMIQSLLLRVRNDFAGLNVQVMSTSDAGTPATGMTRVFFGTYNPALLGLADSVDEFNSRPTEEAIIYTDTFRLFMPLNPSVDEMAQALANVTSHEIGHLLGLNHTEDVKGIMDITASANQLLLDQIFTASMIEHSIFPIGDQDARVLLFDAVGGVPNFLTQPAPPLDPPVKQWIRAARKSLGLRKADFLSCGSGPCKVHRAKQNFQGTPG